MQMNMHAENWRVIWLWVKNALAKEGQTYILCKRDERACGTWTRLGSSHGK